MTFPREGKFTSSHFFASKDALGIQSEITAKTLASSGCSQACVGRIMPYSFKGFHFDVWADMAGFYLRPWAAHVQLIGRTGLRAGYGDTSRAVLGQTKHAQPRVIYT